MTKFKCILPQEGHTLEIEITSTIKYLCDIEKSIKEKYKQHYSKSTFPHHYTLLTVRKDDESDDDAVIFDSSLKIQDAISTFGEDLVLIYYTKCNKDALLCVRLPMPNYSTTNYKEPFIRSIYGLSPESVESWPNFYEILPQEESFSRNSKRSINLSSFSQSTITNRDDVINVIELNILRILNKLYFKDYYLSFDSSHFDWSKTDNITSSYNFKGSPDWSFRKHDNDDTILVISAATKWEVDIKVEGNLELIYNDGLKSIKKGTANGFTRSLVTQINRIFTYLSLNGLQYGVLTTYENTWFLTRPKKNPNQLLISKSFSPNDKRPTLLKIFASFLHMVNNDPSSPINMPDFSISPQIVTKYNKERIKISRLLQLLVRFIIKIISSILPKNSTISTKYLKINGKCLGSARMGGVFISSYKGETIALKLCDISKHPELLGEMQKEVECYQRMKDIQGTYIPKLICNGYILNDMFYVIGTSYGGKRMNEGDDEGYGVITRDEYDLAIKTLDQIHAHDIIHGDIRPENILFDGQRVIRIIDFGFSKISSDEKEKEEEKEILRSLLDQFFHDYDSKRQPSKSQTTPRSNKMNGLYAPEQISLWEDFDEDCKKVLRIEKYGKILNRNIDEPEIDIDDPLNIKTEKDLYELFEDAVNIYLKEFLSHIDESFEIWDEKKLPKSGFTPDFTISRGINEGCLLPIEVKIKHVFENMKTEIHTLYNEKIENYVKNRKEVNKPDIVPPILQTYKYMLQEGFFYGILTTYDCTWVLKFEVDQDNSDVEKVFISRRIENHELVKILICVLLFIFQDEERERKFNFKLEGCKRLKIKV
ncbi:7413_t:CDS:2 [Funneliformis caledonium]|uniref:7413_t:CDS:1 n=1 Tax=Funneliformis caledonium TaxID=1117310 RepID=A0A9N9APC0_9GLOM|nr:7413_t:CDS:2 [Funneliformis caledonium]